MMPDEMTVNPFERRSVRFGAFDEEGNKQCQRRSNGRALARTNLRLTGQLVAIMIRRKDELNDTTGQAPRTPFDKNRLAPNLYSGFPSPPLFAFSAA